METDVIAYAAFLRQNVSELQRLGKEWGMTEKEISSCIERALQEEPPKPAEESKMSVARMIWHWIRVGLRWCFRIAAVIIILFISVYMLTVFHPPAEHYISGALQPYGYALFRFVRMATLPLHDHFNITNFYDSECVVENPWFTEPQYECDLCIGVKSVVEAFPSDLDNNTYINELLDQGAPVIFKGLYHRTVSYDDLYEMYTENKEVMDKSVFFFQSSVIDMNTIADLFTPEVRDVLEESEGVTIHWQTKNMAGGQVMRKMFPRPDFVPQESEVALEKTVFLDGPKTDHYELASSFMEVAWYTQANNDRRILLAPLSHCRSQCSPITVKLQERDILMFRPSVFKVIVLPLKKGISVGFMGSFSEDP
uniref:Uncharacterized protein n=1 Tax=Pinctada fucata TaxID=50426 RepID=A0A194AM26_PINFU